MVAVSGNEGFLNLTDAQLKQKAQLVFNGKSAVAVDKLYIITMTMLRKSNLSRLVMSLRATLGLSRRLSP